MNISTHCLSNPPPEFRNSSQFLSIQKHKKKKFSEPERKRLLQFFSRESRNQTRNCEWRYFRGTDARGRGEGRGRRGGGEVADGNVTAISHRAIQPRIQYSTGSRRGVAVIHDRRRNAICRCLIYALQSVYIVEVARAVYVICGGFEGVWEIGAT